MKELIKNSEKLVKKVGLIGGVSHESTAQYYININQGVMRALGGLSPIEIMLISLNCDQMSRYAHEDDWDRVTSVFIEAAKKLERMGADFIVIPCNSLHIVADSVAKAIQIPVLNIIDCVGDVIYQEAYSKVALLGTKFTMGQSFYRRRLTEKFNVQVEVPDQVTQQRIHEIIFTELCQGKFLESSKKIIRSVCEDFYKNGCQAVILGCTELPLILRQSETYVPLLLSTDIHSNSIVKFSIQTSIQIQIPIPIRYAS